MAIGVIERRGVTETDARGKRRKVKKPFIAGTDFEVTGASLRQSGWGAIALFDVDEGLDIEYEVSGNSAIDVRRYAAVPNGVRRILAAHGCDHPGLALDKFVHRSAGQAFSRHALQSAVVGVNDRAGLQKEYQLVRARWLATMKLLRAQTFDATTTGPLSLHLSRASALENAGICLHPLYGFAYLPGSGLKGLARAYAETLWLPVQSDEPEAWHRIEDVFGWAPNPDRRQHIKDPKHPAAVRRTDDADPESPEIKASSGNIVFHDAWPTAWPPLMVDIVNNHHPDYYQHQENSHPPGDWEDPVPVYFLAVKPGATFTFPISKRHPGVPDDLLRLAHRWLLGALCHLGAGAKTNAGYGAFKLVDGTAASPLAEVDGTWQAATSGANAKRAVLETTLEVVTPAFFAGAEQYGPAAAEGCDLRPATLRGHLRWWWRTMYAGFLEVKTLRTLEAAIWGDTRSSGAVRVVVEAVHEHGESPRIEVYDKRSKANFNNWQKQSEFGIPDSDPHETTQGLWYLSYGMDEGRGNQRRQRRVLEPPVFWRLRLVARSTTFFSNRADAADPSKSSHGMPITAQKALNQAKAALWLLCHFGAVGSKGRKGFGSLTANGLEEWTLDKCRQTAKQLRTELNLPNIFDERQADSSSLERMLGPVEVKFSWPNVWHVLDQVGFAYQVFAKKYEHRREKMALGLPRRIGAPVQGTFNPKRPVTTEGRHASPVHIHVARSDDGFVVRTVAFPAAYLPDLQTSTEFLKDFLTDFGKDLQRRAGLRSLPPGPSEAPRRPRQQTPSAPAGPILPKPGDRVEAVLLEERTKRGGWKARHEPSGLSGPIHNTDTVPAHMKPGDRVELVVASVSHREIAFRWPVPANVPQASKKRKK
jgi:CRISPR-associated protein Cmr6